jgi:hypothetical protein
MMPLARSFSFLVPVGIYGPACPGVSEARLPLGDGSVTQYAILEREAGCIMCQGGAEEGPADEDVCMRGPMRLSFRQRAVSTEI